MPKNELIFREEDHSYWIGERRLLSVTQALHILDDRPKIDPWYLQRGTFIHKATEYLDRDELDLQTLDDRILPYFNAYVKFREDTRFAVTDIEYPLYHPEYFYAGKIDRLGFLNNRLVLVDLKSGTKAKVDELQIAAYWELCRANHNDERNLNVKDAFVLYLKEDSNYSIVKIERPRLLLPIFLACLTVIRFKEGL